MIPKLIKQAGTAIGNLFKPYPPTVVGLDIGSTSIKIAELRRTQSQPELVAATIEELPANTVRDGYVLNTERLTETLQQAWVLHGIEGKHVVLSLSGQAVVIREVTFPEMNDKELRQAIKWELDKYIPATETAKYYFDFAKLDATEAARDNRVLLVAAPLKMITGITNAVKQAGLKPLAIDIEPLALQRTMEKADNVIMIDIGANCCQLNLFQQGFPLVSRFIPLSGARFTEVFMQALDLNLCEAEKLKSRTTALMQRTHADQVPASVQHGLKLLLAELAREIRRTADYFQMQNREAAFDRIILTGGGAKLANLPNNLSELLTGMQVITHSPLRMLQISPSINLKHLQNIELQMAIAVGLALRGSDENNGD